MKTLSVVLLLISLPLCAQKQSAPSQPESVLLGSGDQIDVKVLDTPEFSGTASISDSGEIRLETGNLVKVAGLSTFAAATAVEESLIAAKLMNHPHVDISIIKYESEPVVVVGQVKLPGNYELGAPRSVLDVLNRAGGLGDLADRNIILERKGTHEQIRYYVPNNVEMESGKELLVYPGDQIMVPKVGVVYVLGDVGRPGAYPMDTNDSTMTALQAIAVAGGTNNTAAPSRSVMMRKDSQGYQKIKLKLKDIENGKSPNVSLLAGDIIYVPFSYGRNLAVNGAQIVASAGQAAVFR